MDGSGTVSLLKTFPDMQNYSKAIATQFYDRVAALIDGVGGIHVPIMSSMTIAEVTG